MAVPLKVENIELISSYSGTDTLTVIDVTTTEKIDKDRNICSRDWLSEKRLIGWEVCGYV